MWPSLARSSLAHYPQRCVPSAFLLPQLPPQVAVVHAAGFPSVFPPSCRVSLCAVCPSPLQISASETFRSPRVGRPFRRYRNASVQDRYRLCPPIHHPDLLGAAVVSVMRGEFTGSLSTPPALDARYFLVGGNITSTTFTKVWGRSQHWRVQQHYRLHTRPSTTRTSFQGGHRKRGTPAGGFSRAPFRFVSFRFVPLRSACPTARCCLISG